MAMGIGGGNAKAQVVRNEGGNKAAGEIGGKIQAALGEVKGAVGKEGGGRGEGVQAGAKAEMTVGAKAEGGGRAQPGGNGGAGIQAGNGGAVAVGAKGN